MDGEDVDDDNDVSIKASQVDGRLKAKTPAIKPKEDMAGSPQTTIPPKKKGWAASLFNSRLNVSTDNISLSSWTGSRQGNKSGEAEQVSISNLKRQLILILLPLQAFHSSVSVEF